MINYLAIAQVALFLIVCSALGHVLGEWIARRLFHG